MARPRKEDEFKLLQLRMKIADMYCRCMPMREIAEHPEINLSIQAVSTHLKAIRMFWLSHIAQAFDERMADTLGRIDRLENEAWKGWERSCQDAESTKEVTEKGLRIVAPKQKGRPPQSKMMPVKHSLEKFVRGQAGDSKFLSIIGECIDRRARILKVTEDQPINNVYLDFGSLLDQAKDQSKISPVDVIEHRILEAGQVESDTSSQSPLPNGLHELPDSDSTNGTNGESR